MPAVNLNGSGVSLRSGDVLNVQMFYDGDTLTMQITDTATLRTLQTSWPVDIPTIIGAPTGVPRVSPRPVAGLQLRKRF